MKKSFLIILLFVGIVDLFGTDYPTLFLSAERADSNLFYGEQMDFLSDSLTPSPDLFGSKGFLVNVKYFMHPNVGLESSYTVFNYLDSVSSGNNAGITSYNLKNIEFGCVLKYIPSKNTDIYSSWLFSAGVTYSMLEYAKDLNDLMLKYADYIYPIKPEFGWYTKLGFQTNISRFFFIGIAAKVSYYNNMIEVSNVNFDGFYWTMPIYVGLSY